MIEKDLLDFRDLTCTNFMIKLKILVNKMKAGESMKILSTREQFQNLPKKIFKNPLTLKHELLEANKYLLHVSKS
ncbi:hypothetical protein GF325_16975 [Candidatus Bathyarchaeota archaeon]|nr:hypothetical protein [Candidatus Bathyarchaeota archaeon]